MLYIVKVTKHTIWFYFVAEGEPDFEKIKKDRGEPVLLGSPLCGNKGLICEPYSTASSTVGSPSNVPSHVLALYCCRSLP